MIHVARQLDRETYAKYALVVSVKDSDRSRVSCSATLSYIRSIPPQSATTTVSIILTDVNDNSPKFTATQPVVFRARENTANVVLGTVQAGDADLGLNAQVRYSVDSNRFGNKHNFPMFNDVGHTVVFPLTPSEAKFAL